MFMSMALFKTLLRISACTLIDDCSDCADPDNICTACMDGYYDADEDDTDDALSCTRKLLLQTTQAIHTGVYFQCTGIFS